MTSGQSVCSWATFQLDFNNAFCPTTKMVQYLLHTILSVFFEQIHLHLLNPLQDSTFVVTPLNICSSLISALNMRLNLDSLRLADGGVDLKGCYSDGKAQPGSTEV